MNHLKPFGMALTLVLLLPSLGLLAASGQTAPETPPSIDRPSAGTQADSVPGEIVVGLEQPDPQFDKEVRGKGGKVLDKIESLKALLIKVPVNAEDAFIKAIKNNPNVLYAERNSVIRAVGTPNDSYWSYQWNQRQIKANDAWDTEPGDLSVIVAVVDSGVKYSHPDLSGRVINGYDFINDDNDAIDDDGHGTHVAGIVGAKTNNARGVAGTGELSILAVKVLDSSGSGSNWSVSEGIKYAADYGADIINLSLGCYCTSTLMEDATNYAYNTKGKLLVGSAGNDDTNAAHYPSSYPTVISVASTNNKDNKANHSNWGADIELSAPGGDKGGGPYTKTYVLSTWKDNNYAFAYGTSMATPHVAGVG
ncbi:MAG: S8 family serine peptidase, partial [Nitrososphaerales archaeon]